MSEEDYAPAGHEHLFWEVAGVAALDHGHPDLAQNLASLNDIVAILAAQVSSDPEFTSLVRDTLAQHSRALGFEHGAAAAP